MMAGTALLALLLAIIPPPGPPASPVPTAAASPSPQAASPRASAPPHEFKTIEIEVSTPYCNSLATHFNSAFVPLLANDRTLDGVSVQLDDLNTLFTQPDYIERFLRVRDTLGHQVDAMSGSLHEIQDEINALRNGEHLTTDPKAASQIHLAAQELQTAYDKQRQLTIDLEGMHQAMIEYPIERVHHNLGGFSLQEMAEPADMKDVKDYLRFQGQRDVIASSEDKAVDIAYDVAEQRCSATSNATSKP